MRQQGIDPLRYHMQPIQLPKPLDYRELAGNSIKFTSFI